MDSYVCMCICPKTTLPILHCNENRKKDTMRKYFLKMNQRAMEGYCAVEWVVNTAHQSTADGRDRGFGFSETEGESECVFHELNSVLDVSYDGTGDGAFKCTAESTDALPAPREDCGTPRRWDVTRYNTNVLIFEDYWSCQGDPWYILIISASGKDSCLRPHTFIHLYPYMVIYYKIAKIVFGWFTRKHVPFIFHNTIKWLRRKTIMRCCGKLKKKIKSNMFSNQKCIYTKI